MRKVFEGQILACATTGRGYIEVYPKDRPRPENPTRYGRDYLNLNPFSNLSHRLAFSQAMEHEFDANQDQN